MTEFLKPSFSVHLGGKAYRDNWERIFKKKESTDVKEEPDHADDDEPGPSGSSEAGPRDSDQG